MATSFVSTKLDDLVDSAVNLRGGKLFDISPGKRVAAIESDIDRYIDDTFSGKENVKREALKSILIDTLTRSVRNKMARMPSGGTTEVKVQRAKMAASREASDLGTTTKKNVSAFGLNVFRAGAAIATGGLSELLEDFTGIFSRIEEKMLSSIDEAAESRKEQDRVASSSEILGFGAKYDFISPEEASSLSSEFMAGERSKQELKDRVALAGIAGGSIEAKETVTSTKDSFIQLFADAAENDTLVEEEQTRILSDIKELLETQTDVAKETLAFDLSEDRQEERTRLKDNDEITSLATGTSLTGVGGLTAGGGDGFGISDYIGARLIERFAPAAAAFAAKGLVGATRAAGRAMGPIAATLYAAQNLAPALGKIAGGDPAGEAEATTAALGLGGLMTGMSTGAAFGSAAGPVGTLVGGAVGGIAGTFAGESLGPEVDEQLVDRAEKIKRDTREYQVFTEFLNSKLESGELAPEETRFYMIMFRPREDVVGKYNAREVSRFVQNDIERRKKDKLTLYEKFLGVATPSAGFQFGEGYQLYEPETDQSMPALPSINESQVPDEVKAELSSAGFSSVEQLISNNLFDNASEFEKSSGISEDAAIATISGILSTAPSSDSTSELPLVDETFTPTQSAFEVPSITYSEGDILSERVGSEMESGLSKQSAMMSRAMSAQTSPQPIGVPSFGSLSPANGATDEDLRLLVMDNW